MCQRNKSSFYWDMIPVNNGNHRKIFPHAGRQRQAAAAAIVCVSAPRTLPSGLPLSLPTGLSPDVGTDQTRGLQQRGSSLD